MARLVPSDSSTDAPDSERQVLARLEETLLASWTILHGRRLVVPGQGDGLVVESEADILILDPARGYVVLEVKGGGVGRDPDGWYSVDRRGKRHRIKSPGDQASRIVRLVDRYLSGQSWFRSRGVRLRFGWGVALPDVDVRAGLGPGLPRELVVDRLDLADDPRRAMDRVFEAQLGSGAPVVEGAERAFVAALAPCFQLVTPLASEIDREGLQLVRLTEGQAAVLDHLEAWPRAVIEGGAGTGKTMLAMEKARRIATSGQRVLLLCFNRPLANFLATRAEGFVVNSFHGLCHDLCQQARIPFRIPSAPKEQQRFWENEAPDLLEQALRTLPDERFDALVVDEGQDFREHWWIVLEDCLRTPGKGTLYVFYDPNQDLYGGGPPKALGILPARLRWNCRNTGRIAEYSARLIQATAELRPGTPEGTPVEDVRCAHPSEVPDTVRRLLHRFVMEGRVAADRVVVLSTHNPQRSSLAHERRLGSFELISLEDDPGPNRIRLTSLQRFKGLEADVVILIDVEAGARTSSARHLYVGASRARHRLVVIRVGAVESSPVKEHEA